MIGNSSTKILFVLFIFFSLFVYQTFSQSKSERPNILIVLTDDHSVPHVGCYGNPDIKTPNLDKLASQGMRFDRMYVTAPQCVPARATIMTGQSSVKTNMTRFSAPLSEEIITFPELLKKSGYFTGVAGRIYHLDGHNIIGSEPTKKVFEENDLVTFPRRLDFVKIADGGVGHIDQMVEFFDVAPNDKPWFLQLSFDDPHRPLDKDAIDELHDPTKLKLPPFMPDTRLVREDFANYYDEISRFDGDFGKIMAILKERNLIENTIIMFMGDNGGAVLRAKGTLYEWGLNVPMIMRWDGVIKPGSVSKDLISSEDLAPTFLDIAGVKPAEDMKGPSFYSLLKGEKFNGRKSLCAARGSHGYNLPLHTADFDLSRCVVTDRYKFIYNPLWQIPYTPVDVFGLEFWKDLQNKHAMGELTELHDKIFFSAERPIFELYDLKNDPYELNNLNAQVEYAEIENELKTILHEWMVLQNDYVPLPIPDFNPFLKR